MHTLHELKMVADHSRQLSCKKDHHLTWSHGDVDVSTYVADSHWGLNRLMFTFASSFLHSPCMCKTRATSLIPNSSLCTVLRLCHIFVIRHVIQAVVLLHNFPPSLGSTDQQSMQVLSRLQFQKCSPSLISLAIVKKKKLKELNFKLNNSLT